MDVANVENLNAASYHVSFDPNVLELVSVTGGEIGGVSIPVDLWNLTSPGIAGVVQSLPSLGTASGSGYLAALQLHVIGVQGGASEIGFDYKTEERVLSNNLAEAIPTQWAGSRVQVTVHGTAAVGIDAPAQIGEGSAFLARITVSQMTGFNAASYDVSFDPSVVRLTNVTAGNVGGVSIPVDLWNEATTGTVTIVQDIPGLAGATGSGHLAELRFDTVGAEGSSSPLTLADVVLGDTQGANIPVEWTGATVSIVAPVPPEACTIPQPPNHDFGEMVVGTTAGWAFELSNCGGGELNWTI